jgi:beta-lactamase regulating signal transducer with metallopeptidase domain
VTTLDTLFLQILNMTITGSYVILAIIVVRMALWKASKGFSYALWSVAAFRLLCPISFSSVVSLFSLKPFNMAVSQSDFGQALTYVPSDIGLMQTPKITSGIETADRFINGALPVGDMTTSVNPIQIWTAIASGIWLAGLLGLLTYGFVSYIKVKRLVSNAVRLEGNLYETDQIPTPFVLGFLKPRIYLPFRMPESERIYILQHERHHMRRGDHLIKPLSFLLLAVHWFNPLVWIAYYLMIRDMEMSCDESVLRQMGPSLKHDYSESLLALAMHQHFPAASPLAFGESNARLRVRNVLHFRRPKVWITITSLVLSLAVLLACAANPKGPGSKSFVAEMNLSTDSSSLVSSPEIELASRFIKDMLDIPNRRIKVALEGMDPANQAANDAAIESAISSLAGDRLAERLLTNAGTSFRNQVIDFHYQAISKGFTIKPSSVKVIPNTTQKNLYSYEATAIFSDGMESEKPLLLIGRIQFDNSGKINFVSLEGSDYQAIWAQYAPRQVDVPIGDYQFKDVVYVGGISSATRDALVQRKAETVYQIGEDFLKISNGNEIVSFSNITYLKEIMTDAFIEKSYNTEDANLINLFKQYQQRYRYSLIDQDGLQINYYVFQFDGNLFVSQFAKTDMLIFSIDQLT